MKHSVGARVGAMRSAVVSVFLCVLAVATSVLADGAWTLWMMGGDSPWDSVGSFPTRAECLVALHQQAQAVEKLGLKVTEDVAAGSFTAADADRNVRGQCMLDTSDPRGPRQG